LAPFAAPAAKAPLLLEQVCRLTAEVLECEYCCTLLWRPGEAVFVPTAHHGATVEEWEAIRQVQLPRAALKSFIERLEREEVIQASGLPRGPLARVWPGSNREISACIYTALRGEDGLMGFHSAGRRQEGFTSRQEGIARDIGRLVSVALESAQLLEELGAASQLKSEFVATMSHEMRTPLHIILGYSDLLRDHAFGTLTAEQADTLQRMEKSAREMLSLVNGALDLSRLEGGRICLDVEETHVATVLREIDVETQPLQDKPGVTFVYHVPASLPALRTDPLKLKVALKNLVVNALKFTDQGVVTVEVTRCDGGISIAVTDSGTGMSPETLPIIFEPFRQAPGLAARHQGGVGLGLYIVRRILEILGGTISAESTPGRGSIFRVWVPHLAPPAGDTASLARS
jgi:signal transduction histidine kinase